MANGFGSFYVGSSGLKNSQNALNTTANNMANVNTTGYVRQQVRFSDKHYITRNNPTAGTNKPEKPFRQGLLCVGGELTFPRSSGSSAGSPPAGWCSCTAPSP